MTPYSATGTVSTITHHGPVGIAPRGTEPSGGGARRAGGRGGAGAGAAAGTQAFTGADWRLLAGVAAIWGSSFLLIEIGLEHFSPALVTLLRVAFGAATVFAFPASRRAVPRSDWGAVALLGVLWMAVPLLLFPYAQQHIDSSLAGMLNGGVPLFAAAVATLVARRLPGRAQLLGLLVGFAGVVVVSWPAVQGARATALGAALVVLACLCYGAAINLAVPLQRRHGALPVLLRAQLFALVVVAPLGLAGIGPSTFGWSSLAAVVALGAGGTALAFVGMSVLVGRVGAARGSVAIYFIPLVAVALGVSFRGETVAVASLLGTALVSAGAYLTSRRDRPAAAPAPPAPAPAPARAA